MVTSDRWQAFLGNVVQEGIGKYYGHTELHVQKSSEK